MAPAPKNPTPVIIFEAMRAASDVPPIINDKMVKNVEPSVIKMMVLNPIFRPLYYRSAPMIAPKSIDTNNFILVSSINV